MNVRTSASSVNNITSDSRMHSNSQSLEEVLEWLHNLSIVFDEQSREIEIATGLNKNHALAIKLISRFPSLSVSALAKRMHINSVSMVRILDHLEKHELITRIRSKKDRRVVEIRITEKANDIDLILGNMTHDILMRCLEATDDGDLLKKLTPLKNFTSHLETD
ncbi:MAG: MarR family transcriptional regulator [Desulfuromonadaceae bacterium]|nr:MarR family transcriptional regulator [Desulfuromonadaceae bacterium]